MSDKKSVSIQEEGILVKQIRNYPCLYDKSEKLYKECNTNKCMEQSCRKAEFLTKWYKQILFVTFE